MWTPIAEEEYRRGSIIVNSNGDKMGVGTTVSVDRRSCHEVPVHVKEPGSRLCWQFETEEHDIGFSVSLTTGDETQEELVVRAWERADSHMRPRDGSLLCVDPGTCTYADNLAPPCGTLHVLLRKKRTITMRSSYNEYDDSLAQNSHAELGYGCTYKHIDSN